MDTQEPWNKSILYGVLSLAGGIAFIWYFIWRILEAMAQKQDNLRISMKGVGIGPFLVVFGLYLLIFRPPNLKPNEMSPRQRIIYWVMAGLSLGSGILTFLWFKQRTVELGYSF
jgi:hypothetical protein